MDSQLSSTLRRYERLAAHRWPRVRDFYGGRRPFLVWTYPPSGVWGDVRTPEQSFRANMETIRLALDVESDAIPYLEPWHGVGIYACSFGCRNEWCEGTAPYTRVAFEHIRDALEFEPLRPAENEMMQLVMETIRYFKRRVGDAVPIALTDTQSANDTATLVVDPSNFMVECLTEPESAHRLLRRINDAIIEFSEMQIEAIGEQCRAGPGHIMPSAPGVGGISISDDNQSFCSADFNRQFTNPYLDELGRHFAGVAVHSCGRWSHAMPGLLEGGQAMLVDCAVHRLMDPSPNDPAEVARAVEGSGVAVQMRCPGTEEAIDEVVHRAARPGVRLCLLLGWAGDAARTSRIYHYAVETLTAAYEQKGGTSARH